MLEEEEEEEEILQASASQQGWSLVPIMALMSNTLMNTSVYVCVCVCERQRGPHTPWQKVAASQHVMTSCDDITSMQSPSWFNVGRHWSVI